MTTSSDFGQAVLAKYGWKHGQGLGKNEAGITKAIRVSQKNDTKGIGVGGASDHSVAWWDNLYNKSVKGLTVNSTTGGDVSISTTESVNVRTEKAKAYFASVGHTGARSSSTPPGFSLTQFVKSSSTANRNSPQNTTTTTDFSVTLTDQELFLACNGAMASKGARGSRQLAKLQRVDPERAAIILEKTTIPQNPSPPRKSSKRAHSEKNEERLVKKSKRKRDKHTYTTTADKDSGEVESICEKDKSRKKKKKKSKKIKEKRRTKTSA
ncbi:hypothetical protein IWQ62_000836 [Dispira parvispora]|uniref:G-patch domain-containing protein n=1 Tax=Dispira parvispora TaxID=1520584 RepID=A0A9W8ATY9_9FUNG|nr:hypothetical protein IWQ62_000836 [Dispira parvispora]